MSAARRGHSLKIDLAGASAPSSRELPPIAALFQIVFDVKAGYTIAWKRAISGVELDGVVEFKSLPSGLHTVREDLIYFVHNQYAGVSAFINEPAGEEERNALMLAVGALVPLSYGRLGRSWRHAQSLRNIARELAKNTSKTQALEDFWELHKLHDELGVSDLESPVDSPSSLRIHKSLWSASTVGWRGHKRNRSESDATGLVSVGQTLTPFHPARSLTEFLSTFGPLVFPIYKAALVRKRILLLTKVPVEQTCNFVYDISILSNIPIAVADLLATEPSRLKPLFTVGVHDIPMLEEEARRRTATLPTPSTQDLTSDDTDMFAGGGWVACSADSVLYQKESLYDVCVTMPPPYSKDAKKRIWPIVEFPRGTQIKATQRDLRRYRALRRGLDRYRPAAPRRLPDDTDAELSSPAQEVSLSQSIDLDEEEAQEETAAEPLTWSELAYSSFMWWASAGEKRQDLDDQEIEANEGLLRPASMGDGNDDAVDDYEDHNTNHDTPNENAPLLPSSDSPITKRRRRKSSISTLPRTANTTPETDIIAYFHRLTTRILSTLSSLIDANDGPLSTATTATPAEDDEEESVYISSEDMSRMGLDTWSENDRIFVGDITRLYFGRVAEVERAGLECCGVRVF